VLLLAKASEEESLWFGVWTIWGEKILKKFRRGRGGALNVNHWWMGRRVIGVYGFELT
jgi:hypothetical protein